MNDKKTAGVKDEPLLFIGPVEGEDHARDQDRLGPTVSI